MSRITKRWKIAPRITPQADENLIQYPPVIRQLLFNRGYDTAEKARQFLEDLPPEGTDPFNMIGMEPAVERILQAVRSDQSIIIYGDYDVDGVTATTLLVECLNALSARVRGYIPNRFEEGYGLNIDALKNLRQEGVKLVITVDCGIRSFEEAEYAARSGIDLIISDHHQPLTELPLATAIINPKQPGDNYTDKDLAGVGIAYKLAEALFKRAAEVQKNQLRDSPAVLDNYHDLVALGTVADLAPLIGENRYLVSSGLKQFHHPRRQGIQALIGVSGKNPKTITASDIGYVLGPRLNAAGRLESALEALELLLTTDALQAGLLAQKLDNQNRKRQKLTRELQKLADDMVFKDGNDPLVIFASAPEFNPGVIGLVASKMVEEHYRPAIIAHLGKEITRASCRSIPEFHITEALDQCANLMEHHGGHAAAAGFTIRNENVPQLLKKLREIAMQQLSGEVLKPTLLADMEVRLTDLNHLLHELVKFQPTGYGNPSPKFVTRNLLVNHHRTVGKDNSHLKFSVSKDQVTYDAIAFQQGYWDEDMPRHVDLFYNLEENEFMGVSSLQLKILDIHPARINPQSDI
jgi:single-stranded-DNA-specific exonuclease